MESYSGGPTCPFVGADVVAVVGGDESAGDAQAAEGARPVGGSSGCFHMKSSHFPGITGSFLERAPAAAAHLGVAVGLSHHYKHCYPGIGIEMGMAADTYDVAAAVVIAVVVAVEVPSAAFAPPASVRLFVGCGQYAPAHGYRRDRLAAVSGRKEKGGNRRRQSVLSMYRRVPRSHKSRDVDNSAISCHGFVSGPPTTSQF